MLLNNCFIRIKCRYFVVPHPHAIPSLLTTSCYSIILWNFVYKFILATLVQRAFLELTEKLTLIFAFSFSVCQWFSFSCKVVIHCILYQPCPHNILHQGNILLWSNCWLLHVRSKKLLKFQTIDLSKLDILVRITTEANCVSWCS